MRASDSGTPHWLLRLPAEAMVRPWRSKRAAQRLLGAGLADAAGDGDDRRRACAARAARPSASSAACVSATIEQRRVAGDLGGRAAAPPPRRRRVRARRRRNRGRRIWGRASATNRSPGRDGAAVDRDAGARASRALLRPPVAAAASAAVQSASCRRASISPTAARATSRVVERQHRGADDLAASRGPCRRSAAHRPAASTRHGRADGVARDRRSRARPGQAARMARRIAAGILAARIVVGDDGDGRRGARRSRPSCGRLPASRSPPQPNTTTRRPRQCGRSAGARFRAHRACARNRR